MTSKDPEPLEIRRVSVALEKPLADFFTALQRSGAEAHFHPHPLDGEAARRIASYNGRDLYYVLLQGSRVLGYGMLRGWDEGYTIPSLGIAIHPVSRGMGYGKLVMEFLHAAARSRGATRIRLKVHPENQVAVRLYTQLGYIYQPEMENNQLVGYLDLT